LLKIKCQPEGEITSLTIPDGVHFVGIDSGVRHAVTGASYSDVRVAAFMGYRIIADHLDLKFEMGDLRKAVIDDPLYHGFLCNIPLAEFQTRFAARLPERMQGAEFLARFGGTTDAVTAVEPNRRYPVRAATTHPIEEQARVEQFIELLGAPVTPANLTTLGTLMYEAHASYSHCGLGSEATDALVEAVRRAGPERGLLGAKITGGGSGGTVALLARGETGLATATAIAAQHAHNIGLRPYLFRGSSPGAMQVEPLLLECL
jgi:L-arabinokinase